MSTGSEAMGADTDYERWLAEVAKECRSAFAPCEGCMQGAMCDEFPSSDFDPKGYDDGEDDGEDDPTP